MALSAPLTVDALVLCGGQGSRMGGIDKGWLPVLGQSLIERQLHRLAGLPIAQIWISANRHLDRYRELGYPVIADTRADACGPMAGIEAALLASRADAVIVIPCDVPDWPDSLLASLTGALQADVDVVVAADAERVHPGLCLVRQRQAAVLTERLNAGHAGLWRWQQAAGAVTVCLPGTVANLNTPAALASWQAAHLPASLAGYDAGAASAHAG